MLGPAITLGSLIVISMGYFRFIKPPLFLKPGPPTLTDFSCSLDTFKLPVGFTEGLVSFG